VQLAVVRRSTLERLTIFRYIAYRWQRQVPLLTVREDRQIHEVRAAQQVEYARFRRNCFPYNDGHGLGISGGGVLVRRHILGGAQRPPDPLLQVSDDGWFRRNSTSETRCCSN